jgi:hypothetical protein
MARVSVPALKEFTYLGRSFAQGEIVNVEAVEALALARRGCVTLTRHDYSTRDVTADVPEAPRQKRRYRRRDMVAERQ